MGGSHSPEAPVVALGGQSPRSIVDTRDHRSYRTQVPKPAAPPQKLLWEYVTLDPAPLAPWALSETNCAGSADAALTRGSDSRVLSGVEDSSMFTHHAQNAAPHPGPRGGAAGKLGIGEGFSPRIILVDVITSLQKLIF